MLSQLIRYAPIISLIQANRPHRILEVGCGSQGLGRFLSRRFVGVDRGFSDYTAAPRHLNQWMCPVQATGAQLPFKSRSFDLVVLIDVLEHVPPQARLAVLAECNRVARGWIAVGFPCDAHAEDHDRDFHEWLGARSLAVPGWLHEHLEHPFPTIEEVSRVLSASATRMHVLDNAWLPAHRVLMRWEAIEPSARYSAALSDLLAPTAWDWKGHRVVTNLLRFALRPGWPLLRLLQHGPGYRKLIVVEKGGGGQRSDAAW